MKKEYYRNIYAEVDIVATGNKTLPIMYCEEAFIQMLPADADPYMDFVTRGTLYVNDLVYAHKYNRHRRTFKILKKL